jgi:hypothetical protein
MFELIFFHTSNFLHCNNQIFSVDLVVIYSYTWNPVNQLKSSKFLRLSWHSNIKYSYSTWSHERNRTVVLSSKTLIRIKSYRRKPIFSRGRTFLYIIIPCITCYRKYIKLKSKYFLFLQKYHKYKIKIVQFIKFPIRNSSETNFIHVISFRINISNIQFFIITKCNMKYTTL